MTTHDARQRALEAVSQHCDIFERMELVPPSAQMRGTYFSSIEAVLARAGRLDAYRASFPERFMAPVWYPMKEFLPRLVVAASLLYSPERVSEGMFEIGRRNTLAFMESLLGRMLLRVLARDPKRVLRQAFIGRRQSARPFRWELTFPTERGAVVSMVEEYTYFDSYMLGAAHGTMEAIGVDAKIECVVEDRFCGKHVFSW